MVINAFQFVKNSNDKTLEIDSFDKSETAIDMNENLRLFYMD